ncbi:MAG: hypothetical protein ACLRQX_05160 [Turicibacter sanguinis]
MIAWQCRLKIINMESPISAIECGGVCHTEADLASILEFIEEYQLF